MDFAHLHVHTEYSLLDGFSRIEMLVQQTKSLQMKHLAITDHGAMYGVPEFYKACTSAGIHPVIGVEAYLAEDMDDHSKRFNDDYHHLLLLAKNNLGYSNLLKLTTIANTKGWHLRPRIDKKVLARYAEGLIVTSSCLSGEIPKLLLTGKHEEAYRVARWYQDVFGPENFYLELQEHYGIFDDGQTSPQSRLNPMLYQMHKDLDIEMVVTNDLHYVHPHDCGSHDILLCVQTGKQLDAPKRMRFDSQEYYLKSPAQMAQLFPELPDALTTSVHIAEQCNVDPLAYKATLPKYAIPTHYKTQDEYLYTLCVQGLRERFGEISEQARQRLDYEFDMIAQKGFVSYFLIEWDFVSYARSHGIRCSARGSAAGSLLAYSLGITNVDPLRYQLPFERFFNTERADMPDIDMDFPDNRREEVIDYVARTYGEDCVAQMVTFNTMAAKAAVKDVARVMGQQDIGDRITRMIPTGPKVTLQGSLASVKELDAFYRENGQVQEIIDQALKLEGSVRSTGVHAAGVIIANESLERFVPLQLRDSKTPNKGRITQYAQMHLEERGLIKFDFLGLSNLTILDNAVKYIKQSCGEVVVLEKVPLDEVEGDDMQNEKRRKAFELLASGETTGIFQLEGSKMREYIKQLQPTRIEDVMAMIALYRPGPMDSIPDFIAAKHGRKKVRYLDTRLAEWLEESYGVIVYQDQVLFIGVSLAGFSWGKVNKFRKALSKKKKDEVEGYKDDFIQGCVANGVKREVAEELFTLILPFGGYGFNKAHAASYAVVAFYTAYLKANYTAEFMAATMTTESDDAQKVANAIVECRRMGVDVLRPSVNGSACGFSVECENVRFGLCAIRGIGEGPASEIVYARTEGGPFIDLADLCARIDTKVVTRAALETMMRAGAMDELGPRHQLLDSLDHALSWATMRKQEKTSGMTSLFAEEDMNGAFRFYLNERAQEIPLSRQLAWEKELTGTYWTEHPLGEFERTLLLNISHPLDLIGPDMDSMHVVIGGMVSEVHPFTPKSGGGQMCFAKLEDRYGVISLTVFSRLYAQTETLWHPGAIVLIKGHVQLRQDDLGVICEEVRELACEGNDQAYHIHLTFPIAGGDARSISNDFGRLNRLKRCLMASSSGRDAYTLSIYNPSEEWEADLDHNCARITYTYALHHEILGLLSLPGAVRVSVEASECAPASRN